MSLSLTVLYGVVLLAGVIVQRITGMGSNLVIAPFIVLVLGPYDGVFATNVIGAITAFVCAPALIRHVDWHIFGKLVLGTFLGMPVGIYVAAKIPTDFLSVVIGAMLLAGVWVPKLLMRSSNWTMTWPKVIITGFFAGATNILSAAGGLPIAVLALATGWRQERFAATFQPFYVVVATACAIIEWNTFQEISQPLLPWQWLMTVIVLIAGSFVGTWASSFFPEVRARQGMVLVATVGSLNLLIGSLLKL